MKFWKEIIKSNDSINYNEWFIEWHKKALQNPFILTTEIQWGKYSKDVEKANQQPIKISDNARQNYINALFRQKNIPSNRIHSIKTICTSLIDKESCSILYAQYISEEFSKKIFNYIVNHNNKTIKRTLDTKRQNPSKTDDREQNIFNNLFSSLIITYHIKHNAFYGQFTPINDFDLDLDKLLNHLKDPQYDFGLIQVLKHISEDSIVNYKSYKDLIPYASPPIINSYMPILKMSLNDKRTALRIEKLKQEFPLYIDTINEMVNDNESVENIEAKVKLLDELGIPHINDDRIDFTSGFRQFTCRLQSGKKEKFIFNERQSKVVRLLYKAPKHQLHYSVVFETLNIQIENKQIKNLFSGHKNWRELIKSFGNGIWGLYI